MVYTDQEPKKHMETDMVKYSISNTNQQDNDSNFLLRYRF